MAWSWTGDKPRQGATRPRRQERFPTHGLNCPLGTVLDLSGSGMRVRRESKPPLNVGDPMAMTIGSESQSVKVSGKVAWIKRVSWRSFEVGVQFVDVRPGISAALVQLAQYGFISANSSPAENNAAPKVSPSPKAKIVSSIPIRHIMTGMQAGLSKITDLIAAQSAEIQKSV